MTGRTHDLAAFTALTYVVIAQPLTKMTLATAIVAFTANMIGGLMPDIDQPTAALWHKLPAGSIFGKLISPLFGGHRFISHSIVGMIIFAVGAQLLLNAISSTLIVNMDIVWWSFMIGIISHLVMDTITREGVPWLFPIPWKIGVPPIRALRMKTGGFIEKMIVFPGLILVTGYFIFVHYGKFLDFVKHYIK